MLALLLNRESGHTEQLKLQTLLSETFQKQVCEQPALSPRITWKHIPIGTDSLALIIKDKLPAHSKQKPYYYWVVYNLPKELQQLPVGANQFMNSNTVGWNSFGKRNYHAPCFAKHRHPLEIELIAVDRRFSIHQKISGEILEKKITTHSPPLGRSLLQV